MLSLSLPKTLYFSFSSYPFLSALLFLIHSSNYPSHSLFLSLSPTLSLFTPFSLSLSLLPLSFSLSLKFLWNRSVNKQRGVGVFWRRINKIFIRLISSEYSILDPSRIHQFLNLSLSTTQICQNVTFNIFFPAIWGQHMDWCLIWKKII